MKKDNSSRHIDEKSDPEELQEPYKTVINEIYSKMDVATKPLIETLEVWGRPLPRVLELLDENIRSVADAARKAEEAAKAAKEATKLGVLASEEAERRAEEARQAGQMAAETATKAAASAARKAEEIARSARLATEMAAKNAEAADTSAKMAVEAMRKAAEEAAKKAADAANAAITTTEGSVLKITSEANKAKKTIKELKGFNADLTKRLKLLEERLTKVESSIPKEKVVILRTISKKEAKKAVCDLFAKGETLYYSDIAERLNLDLEQVVEICGELQKRGEIKIDDNSL